MKFLIVTFALLVSAYGYPNEFMDVKHGHGHGHVQQEWEVPVEYVPFTATTTTTTAAPTTVAAPTTSASAVPDVKPTIVEPSKFDNILNVTWSPTWNPASYFSDLQGNVQEKLGSLSNLPFNTGLNSSGSISINVGTSGTAGTAETAGTPGTSSTTVVTQDTNSSLTSLVTSISNYLTEVTNLVNIDGLITAGTATLTSVTTSTTAALTAAYNYLGVVLFPATVIGVFIVGTYMIIYMIVQMLGFVMASKVSFLQTLAQALSGYGLTASDNIFAQKFAGLNQPQRFRRNPDLPTPQVLLDLASKVYKALEKYTQ